MRRTLGAAVVLALALATLAGPASASHAPNSIPMTSADEPAGAALAWLAQTVTSEGCVQHPDEDACSAYWTKWYALTAAHLGEDPLAWPHEDASVGGWLEANADDLRDGAVRSCEQDPNRSEADCADERVFSLSKAILSLRATGLDPGSMALPSGAERDLVEELLAEHTGSEFGRSELANDDIWALLALNSVGYDGSEAEDAIARIETAQGPDGGVSHRHGSLPEVDTTASAMWALAPHEREGFLSSARGYLEGAQISSGEHRACWPLSGSNVFGNDPNAESTAWAIQAIAALGEDPMDWSVDERSPIACLLSFQRPDGSFQHVHSVDRPNRLATQQAGSALAWSAYGSLDGPASSAVQARQATEGEQVTLEPGDGFVRVQAHAWDSYEWTPDEPGEVSFHGVTYEPYPRALEIRVDVEQAEGSAGGGSSDPSSGPSPRAPEVTLSVPERAERNVTTEVVIDGSPGDAPVVGLRVAWGDGSSSAWQATEVLEHTYTTLGEHHVRAWAKDADGRVSEPAHANITVVNARPTLTLEGPERAPRNTPISFTASAEDPDGPIPNVTWIIGDQQAMGLDARFSLSIPGEHVIAARAEDAAGNVVTGELVVEAFNRAPRNLTVEPRFLPANESVVLRASAEDPDGDPIEVSWLHEGQRSLGGQHHLETGAPGETEILVNVTDPYGGWTHTRVPLTISEEPGESGAAAAPLAVETSPEPSPGPTDRDASRPATLPAAVVQLPETVRGETGAPTLVEGTASQANGSIARVEVTLAGTVPVRGTETFRAMLPELPPGSYEFAARAMGEQGSWGPFTNATLVVEPASEPGGQEGLAELGQTPDEGSNATTKVTPVPLLAALLGCALAARRRRAG